MATRKHLSKTGDYRQVNKIQAEDFGVDISMLIDNIKRTPTERIRRHQIALNTVEKLRKTIQLEAIKKLKEQKNLNGLE